MNFLLVVVILGLIFNTLNKPIRDFFDILCLGVAEYTCEDNVNPCGDDAFCNQTKSSLLCQCKPGFQRNRRNRQCEGTNIFHLLLL